MLGKLIKYELRASGRLLLPIYGAVVIMGLISSIFIKLRPDFSFGNRFLTVAAVLSMILFFVLIVAAIIASYIFAIYRYKKNLLDSEGYLMNTLPVSVRQKMCIRDSPEALLRSLYSSGQFLQAEALLFCHMRRRLSDIP